MRFGFGKNWQNFLAQLTEEQIEAAVDSLKLMLGTDTLRGKSFLDVGSGSGLFSLAAHRLGARVHSFDYDTDSVQCTAELKKRFGNDAWIVQQGSVLEETFLGSLGQFDIVYAWGVLHHTGDMWKALKNIGPCVSENGYLFLALYNDQGIASRGWLVIKKIYNAGPAVMKWALVTLIGAYFSIKSALAKILRGRNPFRADDAGYRGMKRHSDLIDWVGGYPFEVARPDDLINFFLNNGFQLTRLKTVGNGHGCNEFIFLKPAH